LALEATIWRGRVAKSSDGFMNVGGVFADRRISSDVLQHRGFHSLTVRTGFVLPKLGEIPFSRLAYPKLALPLADS
jgi:hypothetical protein